MAVLVYTENWDGKFKKSSFELVTYASKVAEMLNTNVVALSIGPVSDEELALLENYGAGKIVSVAAYQFKILDNKVYIKLISDVAEKENAELIILSHDNTGRALAPGLSVRLKAGLVSRVIELPSSTNPFTIKKKVFSGNAFARVIVNTGSKVLTLAKNSFEVVEKPEAAEIEVLQPDVSPGDISTRVKEVNMQTGKILLTDAEIVVSGGRGMKSPDNWGPIEELAELLGAATACSRPVSDEGWRPHQEHTGQTGKIIAPNLYIAVGISGAIQHLAGVSSSRYIVAVNTDKDAPIFEAADYGIVGDAMKILPQLIQAVKEMKVS
jgi:electron transfer flavoprotein alpha subunit